MENLGSPRVLLVGDFMLDNYLIGNVDRISPEAPVVVMNVNDRQEQPGGAGSVAVDLAMLDSKVDCFGVVGEDVAGARLRTMLAEDAGVNVEGLIEVLDRPTTSKQRIVGLAQHRHRQQLMRIDQESAAVIDSDTQQKLLDLIGKRIADCDVVCLEDYNKGVLKSDAFVQSIIRLAREHGRKVIVDPANTGQYERYRGAWLVKPNRRELEMASGLNLENESGIKEAAGKLAEAYDIENFVVTLDKRGAYLYQRQLADGQLVPTRPRNVYDVTGAGDMVLAMLGFVVGGQASCAVKPTLAECVALANVAGGLEVERFGCVGISRSEIISELGHVRSSKLRSVDALLQELKWQRMQNRKVVFTNGCYDLLHPGHVSLLNFAKDQGDLLVVAINSDQSVRQLKGESRPILNQQDRAIMLSALEMVDYVIIFDEPDPGNMVRLITPDVLVKGMDWHGNVVGQDWVEQHGGRVALMGLVEGRSTTGIIERILNGTNSAN